MFLFHHSPIDPVAMVSKSIHACGVFYVVFCNDNQASDSVESALGILHGVSQVWDPLS